MKNKNEQDQENNLTAVEKQRVVGAPPLRMVEIPKTCARCKYCKAGHIDGQGHCEKYYRPMPYNSICDGFEAEH